MIRQELLELSTGITMNVALAGPEDALPAILIHGFPESHRTWREVAGRLEDRVRLYAVLNVAASIVAGLGAAFCGITVAEALWP